MEARNEKIEVQRKKFSRACQATNKRKEKGTIDVIGEILFGKESSL